MPLEDSATLRQLQKGCPVPISGGGGEPSPERWLDLARTEWLDVLQLDALHLGGLGNAHRALRGLQPLGRRAAIGNVSTPLQVAVLAQLAGCFEADLVGWMEWPDYSSDGRSGTHPFALAEQMLQTPQSIEQGELILPEGPGLGVKVNEAVIRRFPYRTGPCSSFQPTGA